MIAIEFKFPAWEQALRNAKPEIDRFIAAQIQFNRGMIFDKEGAHNGRPRWAPLKFRRGQILSKTGTLRKSIGPMNMQGRPGPDGIVRFEGDTVVVGTKLGYARLMNDGTTKLPGGVLRPVKAKALMIPLPAGKQATEEAKTLRKSKGSRGKADLGRAIMAISERISHTKDPGVRAKLQEKLSRYTKQHVRMKTNTRVIFRKWVKIPARPFDDWNDQDASELGVALSNKIVQVLNRAQVRKP